MSVALPPGDIHLVRHAGPDLAVSLHVYGVDVRRTGSSIRRLDDLPVASLYRPRRPERPPSRSPLG